MPLFHYRRWDGTQESPLATAEDIMDHVAREMPDVGDLDTVLRRLLQRGGQFPSGRRMMGLQELMDRLRQARQRQLDRYNLGSMLDDIKQRLDQVVSTERNTVLQALQDQGDQKAGQPGQEGQPPEGEEQQQGAQGAAGAADPSLQQMRRRLAQKRLEQLDQLPADVGGRIQQLQQYDFLDPEARRQFQELLQLLQRQVLQSYFQGLQQALQSMTPEAMQQVREMMRELNELLRQHARGERADFQGFMQRWGQFFPQGLESIEDLLDYLQQTMAQMESLLSSMPADMRQQLEEMLDAVLQDPALQEELARLSRALQRLRPDAFQPGQFPFAGDEPVTLQEALRLMGEMNSMDQLERQVLQALRSNDASSVDTEEVHRLLGEESAQLLEQLQQLTKMLEEAGFIRRRGDRWELTPQAIRRIGHKALQDIFARLRLGNFGSHNLDRTGIGVEALDETKPYEFGDPFLLDTKQTVVNAVFRQGPGTPVQVAPEDFEVTRTGVITNCATVLMLDMSFSMMMAGCFQAGRKVALALDTLIRTQFPRDSLDVVAFSYFVLVLKPQMLLDSYWVEYGGGTNFQEALYQARRALRGHHAQTKQIIMVTDGEPTTYNSWDPTGWGRPRNGLQETLREVVRCTQEGITINTFLMDRRRHTVEFVRLMTRINRGRVFFASPDRLGEYILWDYVTNIRKHIR